LTRELTRDQRSLPNVKLERCTASTQSVDRHGRNHKPHKKTARLKNISLIAKYKTNVKALRRGGGKQQMLIYTAAGAERLALLTTKAVTKTKHGPMQKPAYSTRTKVVTRHIISKLRYVLLLDITGVNFDKFGYYYIHF